ncbi:AAA family ATPase [Carboxylicivirga sp. RSCT41]|uniref:AAA family ATPase n=1 Tax=Carboxylicivirga agarovorans TaxID=3417570 RepID=UPI003D3599CC
MQLLQLRIKNLNSLKGEHLIDFENGPIGNTGLFAITGPTGAGKSTILDAITLALYNQTPRSGSVSKNDIARLGSIITRNTDEAWAQLDYRVKETTYRSQWGISRNRNGNLRDYTLVLSKQEKDGRFISMVDKRNEVPKENARLIGLNFDQFLRSILLSQGDFARFLKSNANERGELLEKITGTEIYRMLGRACYERRGKEYKELERLKIQLEGIEILTEEERKQAEVELERLTKDCTGHEENMAVLRKQVQTTREYTKLVASIEENKAQKNKLNSEIELFKSDRLRLEKHQEIMPLRAEILVVEQCQKGLKEKQAEKADKSASLKNEDVLRQKTQEQLSSLIQEIDRFNKKQEETQLLIKNVRALDSEIKVAQSSYQSLEEQNRSLGKQVDALHEEIRKQEANLGVKEKNISAIKSFLEENNRIAGAGELLSLLEQQVLTIHTNTGSITSGIEQLETSPTKTAVLNAENHDSRLTVIRNAVQQSKQFIREKSEQIPAEKPDIDRLKQQHKDLLAKGQALERLLNVCKEKQALLKEKDSLTKELTTSSKEIVVKEKELGDHEQALKINQKYLDELTIRRERELLEAKYEEARQLLKPNEACPLCGSTQHPYVNHYKSRKNETEESLKERNAQRKDLLNKEKVLLEQLSNHRSVVGSVQKRLDEYGDKLEQYKCSIQQASDKYALKFDEVNEQAVLGTIVKHTAEQEQVEGLITVMEKLEKAIARNKEYSMLANELQALIELHKQVDESLKTMGINSDVPLSDKLTALKKRYTSYARRKEQLQEQEKEYSTISTAWKEKGKQFQEILQVFASQSEELGKKKLELDERNAKRESLFGARVPEDVEQELIAEKGRLEETRKSLEITLQRSAVLAKSLADRLKELDSELNEEQSKLLKQTEVLSRQLKLKGLDSIEAAHALILGEDEVKRLQQKQEGFVKASTELDHSIKEQGNQLSRLKEVIETIKLPEVELSKRLTELEQLLKTGLGKSGSLKQQIETDKQNKEKQKEKVQLIDKQQKNYQRWDELSSLIGDATGNKFSRFAQELTLKQVLQLANNHLKLLTDRYLVKHVKNDVVDELFVVDMYHGNAERSVKTLSGGESFLVSLSLALGLSDLAGQNTVIGSLFIDEGFGTLDQNTLDVALSALEKLQSETNRTIGIISHVPALKERVTTQIELRKDASGYSTLEVRC